MENLYKGALPPAGDAGRTHKARELKDLGDCLRAAYHAAQGARDDGILPAAELEPAIKILKTLQETTRRALVKEMDALKKDGYDYRP